MNVEACQLVFRIYARTRLWLNDIFVHLTWAFQLLGDEGAKDAKENVEREFFVNLSKKFLKKIPKFTSQENFSNFCKIFIKFISSS